jgi:flagellar motor switch protein FliN/FliY
MSDIPDANTNKSAAELRSDILKWCEAWQTCFQNVLTQVSGSGAGPAAVFEISSEALPASASDLWYTITAGGAVRGEMTLRLPAASGTRLALKFLGQPEPAAATVPAAGEAASTDASTAGQASTDQVSTDQVSNDQVSSEHKEALDELLRQITGLAATALAATAGGEVKFQLAASVAPTWKSDAIVCLRTRDEAGNSIAIEIQISPALSAALAPAAKAANPTPAPLSAPATPPVPPPASTPPSAAPAQTVSSQDPSNYNRLMDVGLEVKLRFGTRQMALREVLALSAGIVIELDNALHSPVDLLLDGRLVAQGEVVVVDGKYGLRVTEVVNPQPATYAGGVSPA